MINTLPKVLFSLKPFPFIYRIPMYIPMLEIRKSEIDSIRKGRRVIIVTPDFSPKEESMMAESIINIIINIDNTNVNIPNDLAFNCFLKRSIIKNRLNYVWSQHEKIS